ncbi:MAG: RHS repeat-associated core domain-containing protein [Deltaproteobacteria bacterium]|jgi:RHS repeat-associated protein
MFVDMPDPTLPRWREFRNAAARSSLLAAGLFAFNTTTAHAQLIGSQTSGLVSPSSLAVSSDPPSGNRGVYAFAISPETRAARGAGAPAVELRYSSDQGAGIAGVGWDLPLLYVEEEFFGRVPTSADSISSTGFAQRRYRFVGSMDACELTAAGAGELRCSVQRGDLMVFLPPSGSNDHFRAYDGSGSLYVFGLRVDLDPTVAGGHGSQRWYLTELVDSNSNWTRFDYRRRVNASSACVADAESSDEVTLLAVRWNNVSAPPSLSSVDLGAARCADGVFRDRLVVDYEARETPHWDVRLGRTERTDIRIKKIEVENRRGTNAWERYRTYWLKYHEANVTRRDRLESVTVTGVGCTQPPQYCTQSRLPPTTFSYSDGVTHLKPLTEIESLAGLPDWLSKSALDGSLRHVSFEDFDGDGRRDVVTEDFGSVPPGGPTALGYTANVAFANDTGWDSPTVVWPSHYSPALANPSTQQVDLDGDGKLDILDSDGSVYFNLGNTYERAETHPINPQAYPLPVASWDFTGAIAHLQGSPNSRVRECVDGLTNHIGVLLDCVTITDLEIVTRSRMVERHALLIDMTGDGIDDLVVDARSTTTSPLTWWVYPGYKSGQRSGGVKAVPVTWTLSGTQTTNTRAPQTVRQFFDTASSDSSYTSQQFNALIDVNGDGLPDLLHAPNPGTTQSTDRTTVTTYVALNVGNGFAQIPWSHPTMPMSRRYTKQTVGYYDMRFDAIEKVADFNGDGLSDYLFTSGCAGNICVQFGTGDGFASTVNLTNDAPDSRSGYLERGYVVASDGSGATAQGLVDVDHDGLLDHRTNAAGTWQFVRADTQGMDKSKYADLLVRIDNGLSSGLDVHYGAASQFSGARAPGRSIVVSRLSPYSASEGPGPSHDIEYSGGAVVFDSSLKRYVWTGFETVVAKAESGEWTTSTFDISPSPVMGQVLNLVKRDLSGCPFEEVSTTFGLHNTGFGRVIPYPAVQTRHEREYFALNCSAGGVYPLATFTTRRGIERIDDDGNVLERYDLGDLTRTDDDLCTVNTLAATPGSRVRNRPARTEIKTTFDTATNRCSRLLRATNRLYDGALGDPFQSLDPGDVARGNLKVVEEELYSVDMTMPEQLVDTFVSTRYAYDDLGHRVEELQMFDAQDGTRLLRTFDPLDRLVSTSVKKTGLTQGVLPYVELETTFDYQHVSGMVTSETGPDGVRRTISYDPFGRVDEVDKIVSGATYVMADSSYAYVDLNGDDVVDHYKVTTTTYETAEVTSTTYYDGLGRKSEAQRTLGPDFGDSVVTTRFKYDPVYGRLLEEIGPEFTPPQGAAVTAQRRIFIKDPIGRPLFDIVAPIDAVPPETTPYGTDVSKGMFMTRYTYSVWNGGPDGGLVKVKNVYPPFDPAFPHAPGASEPPPLIQHFDARDRLRKAIDREGQEVRYAYNPLGHLVSIERTLDHAGQSIPVTVVVDTDALGRRVGIDDPDKGVIRYAYDHAGNLTRVWQADAQFPLSPTRGLQIAYDTLGRLRTKKSMACNGPTLCPFADAPSSWSFDGKVNTTFYYDDAATLPSPLDVEHPGVGAASGKLIAVQQGTRTPAHTDYVVWYGYDEMGHRSLEGTSPRTGPSFGPLERTPYFSAKVMTPAGKTLSLTAGEGRWPGAPVEPGGAPPANYRQHASFQLAYDSAGYLQRVDDPEAGLTMYEVSDLDPRGLPRQATLASGIVVLDHSYAIDGRLLTSSAQGPSGTLMDIALQDFDGTGNLLRYIDKRHDYHHRFEFDADSQLVAARTIGYVDGTPIYGPIIDRDYAYDSIGNVRSMTDKRDPSRSRVFFYPDDGTQPNTLVGVQEPSTMTTSSVQSYQGNITQSAGVSYAYQIEDVLRTISLPNGDLIEYDYSGTHEWVRRRTYRGGVVDEDRYRISDGVALDRTSAQNPSLEVTFRAGGVNLFRRTVDIAAQSSSDVFFVVDHLGSIRSVTDDQGSEIAEASYYPYGEPLDSSSPRLGFGGHEHLADTSLVDMGARHYDPTLARFVAADTLVPGASRSVEFNRFAYGQNNPVSVVDRSGRNPVLAAAVFGALLWTARAAAYYSSIENQSAGNVVKGILVAAAVGAAMGAISYELEVLGIFHGPMMGVLDRSARSIVFPRTFTRDRNADGWDSLKRFGADVVGSLVQLGAAKILGQIDVLPGWVASGLARFTGSASMATFNRLTSDKSEFTDDRLPGFLVGSAVASFAGAAASSELADFAPDPTKVATFERTAQRVAEMAVLELISVSSVFASSVVDVEVNPGRMQVTDDGLSIWSHFGDSLAERHLNVTAP